ncbi:MAG TPA: tol-pal system protein YbgF [Roseiarcus sp.]|nr:tol-pal system protein YbgF [Roseiarcus sp.]
MKFDVYSARVGIVCATVLLFGAAPPTIAFAQSGLPPAGIPGAESGDAAALVVRVERLEEELRAANGAIEELQNQQRRLQEQLKRFQEDVEFRFNGANGARPSAAQSAPAPAAAPVVAAAPAATLETGAARPKRSDAFDPATEPGAVGAPKPLGSTAPSAPLSGPGGAVGAPLDLSHPGAVAAQPTPTGPLSDADQPTVIAGISGPAVEGPKEQFAAAVEAYRAGQYEQAEAQFRAFLARNSGSRLAPDATFYLGESYLQRSRPREAAEQYLKLSTDYAKSPRAPEGMLRLGQSLAMLGNNEQACATFGEVGRRFPTAAASIKRSVEREMQKDHC